MKKIFLVLLLFKGEFVFSQDYLMGALMDTADNFVKRAYYAQMKPKEKVMDIIKEAKEKIRLKAFYTEEVQEVEMAVKILTIHHELNFIKNYKDTPISYIKYFLPILKKALSGGESHFDKKLFEIMDKKEIWYLKGIKHESSYSDMLMRILVARQVNANKAGNPLNFSIQYEYLSEEYKYYISMSKIKENEVLTILFNDLSDTTKNSSKKYYAYNYLTMNYDNLADITIQNLKKDESKILCYLGVLSTIPNNKFSKEDKEYLKNLFLQLETDKKIKYQNYSAEATFEYIIKPVKTKFE